MRRGSPPSSWYEPEEPDYLWDDAWDMAIDKANELAEMGSVKARNELEVMLYDVVELDDVIRWRHDWLLRRDKPWHGAHSTSNWLMDRITEHMAESLMRRAEP